MLALQIIGTLTLAAGALTAVVAGILVWWKTEKDDAP